MKIVEWKKTGGIRIMTDWEYYQYIDDIAKEFGAIGTNQEKTVLVYTPKNHGQYKSYTEFLADINVKSYPEKQAVWDFINECNLKTIGTFPDVDDFKAMLQSS